MTHFKKRNEANDGIFPSRKSSLNNIQISGCWHLKSRGDVSTHLADGIEENGVTFLGRESNSIESKLPN